MPKRGEFARVPFASTLIERRYNRSISIVALCGTVAAVYDYFSPAGKVDANEMIVAAVYDRRCPSVANSHASHSLRRS